MTHGRAGSKLFHSLLDWHPQIMCFPRTLHFNKFWQCVKNKKDNHAHTVDAFVDMHPRFFNGECWYRINKFDRADQLGADKKESFSVNKRDFRQNALAMLQSETITRATLFLLLHQAYHVTCGRKLPERALILYHIHTMESEDELSACLSDFSNNVRLLVPIRHPVETMKSSVNIQKMRNTLSCGETFHHQRQVLLCTSEIMEHYPRLDIKISPLESLNRNHENLMKAFVEWIGIEWHDALMVSTMHSKLWWGNSATTFKNGTNPNWKIYNPSGFLEKKDWRIFSALIYDRMKKIGYLNETDTKNPLTKTQLLFLLLLPTAAEWKLLKSIFSLNFWLETIKKIKEEVDDPRFENFDSYAKKELRKDEQTCKGNSNFQTILIKNRRISKQLCRNIRLLNLFNWLYNTAKRIIVYYRFAEKGLKTENVSPLLRVK